MSFVMTTGMEMEREGGQRERKGGERGGERKWEIERRGEGGEE